MNTIDVMVWLLPIIFMIHDFEEIIMVEVWGKRNKEKINSIWPKRQPFGLNYVRDCQTPTFSLGVGVEFLLFSLISLFSILLQNYFLWYGAFLGLVIHMFFIHVLICIPFKNYVPGVITSTVFLIPSIWILYVAATKLNYGAGTILLTCLLGCILLITILPMLHKCMTPWSKWLYKYSQEKIMDNNKEKL